MPELASLHAIRRAATDLLGTRALPLSELIDELRQAGLGLGSDAVGRVMSALDGDGRFWELGDERWISVPNLLDGSAWAVTVPEALPADDCLPAQPDLCLLAWWAIDTPLPLSEPTGGSLECLELDDGSDAFLGPDGWLVGHGGGFLAIEIADGTVTLAEPERPPEPSAAQARALRAAFDARADQDVLETGFEGDPPVDLVTISLEELLWEALLAARDAFTAAPIAPADALLAAAGLERSGSTVGALGTDWAALRRRQRRRRLASIHHLDDNQVDAAEVLLGASYAVIRDTADPLGPRDEEPRFARMLAVFLADPAVCQAFVGDHAEQQTEPEELAAFARRLLEHLDHAAGTGPRWLLARALDHAGDPAGAHAELEVAAASALDHPLALRALAASYADRGDAPGAFALLRRVDDLDVDDDATDRDLDPLLLEVGPYALGHPRPAARRNDRCPCGSGRKYKECHLGKERHPLVDRGPWLYLKARRYLRDGRHRALGAALAATVERASGRGAGFLMELFDSELVDDLALHEGGVFDDFVAERDGILPDDEALLAARWALVPRSLFEAERIAGDELSLRDLGTGDRIVVTNTRSGDSTRPGTLLMGRPLPIEDTWRAYSGFVRVGDLARDHVFAALAGGDPFEIAALTGRTFAPPVMQNTDGEPLCFHELTYRVADIDQAARALAGSALHDDGDGQFALVRDSAGNPDTIIMSMTLAGNELRISVNSDRRADEARSLVAELLPDAVLEDDEPRSLDEVLADPRPPSTEPSSENDPELAAMLDTFIREREQRWIDQPVPALRGLTPREAVDHPVEREQLERLLRSMDDRPGGQGTFDPRRLRQLLDLPSGA